MDLDKPHHHTTATTSDLFICFTSTMKLSKSILSPNHTRDQPLSLPTSLSRRLKTNGSIKGGQSPMFPSTNKKRGSNFENPEPSSPKVTCIGQVKMKTKKKVKQTRSLSNRKSDLSFRKLEQTPDKVLNQIQRSSSVHFQAHQECVSHRNQRWVHLPLTIYEALREFSCLIPCRSSCFSTNGGEKEEKFNGSREVSNSQRSCGDIFARWLVALQEGEGEKPMGVELVVTNKEGEDDRIEEMQSRMRSSRRHVFEDIEFKEESVGVEMKQDEEKARVSICVPPKNALLLMRCRSDPTKMADLTNRFWESPGRRENDVEDNEEEDKKDCIENELVEVLVEAQKCEELEKGCEVLDETSVSVNLVKDETIPEVVQPQVMEMEIESKDEELKKTELALESERKEEEFNSVEPEKGETEFVQVCPHPPNLLDEESFLANKHREEEADSSIQSYSSFSENSDSESSKTTNESDILVEEATLEVEEEKFRSSIRKEIEEILLMEGIDLDAKQTEKETKSDEVGKADVVKIEYRKESVLPDCLLLMMCEPKLSMEVSKETWVCSTDFIIPQRKQVKKEIPEEPKRRRSIDSKPVHTMQDNRSKQLMQPPRSSCSFPAKSMATMIEQKLVNAVAYEPFVLTRCKSEPMRTAAAKVGAAGIGF